MLGVFSRNGVGDFDVRGVVDGVTLVDLAVADGVVLQDKQSR